MRSPVGARLELISIIDCALCRAIPRLSRIEQYGPLPEPVAARLPPSWGSLSTIAVLAPGFGATWGDRDEVRVCLSCGTCYEFRQVYHAGELFEPEKTEWYLSRETPHRAAALLRRAKPGAAGAEPATVDIERRRARTLGILRADLARVQSEPSVAIKAYVVDALVEHDVQAGDWDTLKASLLDHPDPAVRVGAAARVLWPLLRALESPNLAAGRAETALMTDERTTSLTAVLAEALQHRDPIASGANDEAAPADFVSLSMIEAMAGRMNIAIAIPAVAAQLAAEVPRRREQARGIFLRYLDGRAPGTPQLRAKEVLNGVSAIESDEARDVEVHCQAILDRPGGS
jgi:hypothetical protein